MKESIEQFVKRGGRIKVVARDATGYKGKDCLRMDRPGVFKRSKKRDQNDTVSTN